MRQISLLILLLITPGLLSSSCYSSKYIYKNQLIKDPSLTTEQKRTFYTIEKENRSHTESFRYLNIKDGQIFAKSKKTDKTIVFQIDEVKRVKKSHFKKRLTIITAFLGAIVIAGAIFVGLFLQGLSGFDD